MRRQSQHCRMSPEALGDLRQNTVLRFSQTCPQGQGTQPQKEVNLWNKVRVIESETMK